VRHVFRYTWSSSEIDVHLVADTVIGGLCLGGIRIAPDVTQADVTVLAQLMTWKFAAAGIPLGGAKSAVVVRPGVDRDTVIRQAGQALEPFLRTQYLLGVDAGSSAADVVSIYRGLDIDPVAFVQEKARDRGTALRLPEGLTVEHLMNDQFAGALAGNGVVHALAVAASVVDLPLSGKRVSVQGFGNVGHAAALACAQTGLTVVAVSDVHGVVYNPAGLDAGWLAEARVGQGDIDRDALPAGSEPLPGTAWCELPADVLLPAATADCITVANAATVHPDVRIIVEGANGPVTVAAERLLADRGVTVVPDFVANAGLAVTFGLLVTGESTVEEVAGETFTRIGNAVEACVPDRGGAPPYVRDRALANAERYLASVRDPHLVGSGDRTT
jgi:glutamate dehydrogenase (NAD(P)+)